MTRPPTSAPGTESRPPRITAGSERKARPEIPIVTVPTPIGDIEAHTAATRASALLAAQAMAKTLPTGMPWARAASWSKATARIAMPVRVRKNRNTPMNDTAVTMNVAIHDQ